MKRFNRVQLETFLTAVDRRTPKKFKVVILGGAAAVLSFGAKSTMDIDTATAVSYLRQAYETARQETGLPIPFALATVITAPSGYQSRLKRLHLPGLQNLAVYLLEKHDWALSKINRLEDKDMEHLKAAHKTVKFDVKILESRLQSEMSHVHPRERLEIHFLAVIAELFGEREAARIQQALQRRHRPR